jgi:hypothetical protein
VGLLFTCEPCETCVYQSRHLLRYHSGDDGLFMGIVTCETCEEILSLFPSYDNIPHETRITLGGAVRYIARANALASRRAEMFPTGVLPFDVCIACGGRAVYHHDIWQPQYFIAGQTRLPCPRCPSGRVALVPAGSWE